MNSLTLEIRQRLFDLQDNDYKNFHAKLMPTINPELIIGVRTPEVRKLAKEFAKKENIDDFLNDLPHHYYEENNVHAFIIEQIKDFEICISEMERFLPHVDNWATCDMMRPKVFSKNKELLLTHIYRWMNSNSTYTIRFGIEMLMCFYLDENFKPEYAKAVANVRSEEYYVKMMIAWYFATALTKQYDKVLPYLTENRLGIWTHNKTIQKAVESYRVTKEQKEFLRTLKRSAC